MDEDRDYNANDENGDLDYQDCDDDDVHDGDKEHEWDVKSRAFKSRTEADKTSWVHLFTLPLENATG